MDSDNNSQAAHAVSPIGPCAEFISPTCVLCPLSSPSYSFSKHQCMSHSVGRLTIPIRLAKEL